MCIAAAYHYRALYLENLDSAPKINMYTCYDWKSAQLCVSLNCCRHSVKPGSITCLCILHRIRIQNRKYCRKPLIATIYWRQKITNYMYLLKNPAYFDFFLIAATVAFISAAFGVRAFHIWKLDLEPQIFLDNSLKWLLMQRDIVDKLFIMIDLT